MITRMDNVGIVFEDLDAGVAFFAGLGMRLESRGPVRGRWAERVVGLDDMSLDVAMMRTPDGHGRLELMQFHSPAAVSGGPASPPANALGIRRIMFAVDDIDAEVAGLRERGVQLVGEVVRYEDLYKLCYVRGPEGIIVALAEQLQP